MATGRGTDPQVTRDRRVGLFGGTFDPPHAGHVSVARDVADALDLDLVLWVPAREPPHKSDRLVSPPEARLAMTRAAVAGAARFEVSTIEIERPGPSYTVDTLRALEGPDGSELFVIVGVDQYEELDTWKEPREILSRARLAVMDRGGASARSVHPLAAEGKRDRVVFVPVRRVDVSSTEVRARVAAGEDVGDLVPQAVAELIARLGLYRG